MILTHLASYTVFLCLKFRRIYSSFDFLEIFVCAKLRVVTDTAESAFDDVIYTAESSLAVSLTCEVKNVITVHCNLSKDLLRFQEVLVVSKNYMISPHLAKIHELRHFSAIVNVFKNHDDFTGTANIANLKKSSFENWLPVAKFIKNFNFPYENLREREPYSNML